MEQANQIIGSFAEFRADLLADFFAAKKEWEAAEDKDKLYLYDKTEEARAALGKIEANQIEKQLGKVIPGLILKELNQTITNIRQWKEQDTTTLMNLRKKGISYAERAKIVDMRRFERMARYDVSRFYTLDDLEIFAVDNWLSPATDYDRLKELGVTEFVQRESYKMFRFRK